MNYKPEKKTLLLWRLRVSAAAVAAALVFFALCRYSRLFCIPAAAVLLVGVAAVFWYLPTFFSGLNIFVGKNSVVITCGVFVKTTRIMPFGRLVFAGGYSTPLARALKLKGVTFRAARGVLIIPEIGEDAADRLIFTLGGEKDD